jgi:DNA sulfur modification protein DndD
MIIQHLSVKNFGPFKQEQSLKFEPSSPKKSVVLIGGENGFGKTTLLNSIKLCLYGKRATELWGGPNQQAYRQYVAKLFNNQAFADNEREMAIELGLTIWENKIRHELTVRRSYHLTDNRLFLGDNQESLQVCRDGQPLPIADVQIGDAEVGNEYDTLLRVLIPAHFAQFYFFDAEKMRGIFNRPKPEDVAQAVRDLLGLSIYERLSADMRDYRKSKLPALYGKHVQKQAELKAKQAEYAKVQAEVGQIEEEIGEVNEDLTHTNRQLENRETEFKRLGGMHKEELEKLRGELANCEAEYETLTKQLKEAMTGRIASCFLLPLKAPIEQRLQAEREWRVHDMKRNSVEPHIETLQEKIFGETAEAFSRIVWRRKLRTFSYPRRRAMKQRGGLTCANRMRRKSLATSTKRPGFRAERYAT